MTDIVVACVRTGTKYPFSYVTKLQSMVKRHLPVPHRFVCLSDQSFYHDDIGYIPIGSESLQGWWGKMCLFRPEWRKGKKVLYYDLDTVIVNDLTPMSEVEADFAVCENFTRLAGHPTWPCQYGSCAMVIGPDAYPDVWQSFRKQQKKLIGEFGRYGDQLVIEQLIPNAVLLQRVLPKGFFLGRRELGSYPNSPPPSATVVVFAGSMTPANSTIGWVKKAWV